MRTSLSFLLSAVVVATAAACAAPPDGDEAEGSAAAVSEEPDLRPELAQVNDVSVLFPLATSRAAFDSGYLAPASPGAGGALLPEALYERAFGAPGTLQIGGTPAAPALAGLRLVAIRFDPCFAQRGEPSDESVCKNQLRLVFQTLTLKSGRATAADDAVHAFYSISREQLTSGVRTMIALRRRIARDRRLGPLAPHPLLKTASGELDVTVAGQVNALVQSLAGARNLVQFTQFATSGLDTTWNFSGFDVANDAAMKIPTLPASDDTHVAFFAGFTPGQLEGDPAFVPASSASPVDNMQLLGNRATAAAAGADSRRRAFDALQRIEHPDLHTPDTVDCASCHAVEPVRKLIGAKHFAAELASSRGAFTPDARYVPADDVQQPAQPDSGVNIHMFSYKGTTPSIHKRTVNESAAIVARLNAHLLDLPPAR
jgi:hypothetical protein